jgi:cholesterol transport system auxiliary component
MNKRGKGSSAGVFAAGLLALTLGGCVSLLPKSPPVQLFQAGRAAPPAAGTIPAPASPGVGVVLTTVHLPRAAMSDEILTVDGDQAAYLSGARWISPAAVMVQEDAESAFNAQPGPIQLLHRTDFAGASALLTLDLGDFEARYDNGAAAPPVVVVNIRATLSRPDGQTLASQTFTVRQPAADNRIAPIIAAFDTATSQALGLIVAWTNRQAPSIPPRAGATTSIITSTSTTTPR